MRTTLKFITAPVSFWDNENLSIKAKWVALTIDAYCDANKGVTMGVRAIASATNMAQKDVKDALIELRDKGALEINLSEDGEKILRPLLYKSEYRLVGDKHPIGDKPSDTMQIPFNEIADKWAEYCHMLPKIARWTPQRKGKLRSALRQADLSVESLYKCFRIISCTPFLNGTGDFKAHFDWLISKSQNLQKVYEGFYSRSIMEKRDYDNIMNGRDINNNDSSDDYYR